MFFPFLSNTESLNKTDYSALCAMQVAHISVTAVNNHVREHLVMVYLSQRNQRHNYSLWCAQILALIISDIRADETAQCWINNLVVYHHFYFLHFRISRPELFRYSHQLFFLFYGLLIIHSFG